MTPKLSPNARNTKGWRPQFRSRSTPSEQLLQRVHGRLPEPGRRDQLLHRAHDCPSDSKRNESPSCPAADPSAYRRRRSPAEPTKSSNAREHSYEQNNPCNAYPKSWLATLVGGTNQSRLTAKVRRQHVIYAFDHDGYKRSAGANSRFLQEHCRSDNLAHPSDQKTAPNPIVVAAKRCLMRWTERASNAPQR